MLVRARAFVEWRRDYDATDAWVGFGMLDLVAGEASSEPDADAALRAGASALLRFSSSTGLIEQAGLPTQRPARGPDRQVADEASAWLVRELTDLAEAPRIGGTPVLVHDLRKGVAWLRSYWNGVEPPAEVSAFVRRHGRR